MIILDTNVISELMRDNPDSATLAWVDAQQSQTLYTTTVNEAEILSGIALLPAGKRRNRLAITAAQTFTRLFSERLLPFDHDAAIAYAEIVSERSAAGCPVSQFDAQISAIAHSRKASIATRNDKDFRGMGLRIINPWRHSVRNTG